MNKPSYTFIINEASEYNPDWSCRDRLAFHAFNAKGLCAQKRLLDERVSNAVAKGLLKSGAILAYGSLDDFHYNEVMNLAAKCRFELPRTNQAIRNLADRNDKVAQVLEAFEGMGV